MVIWLTPPPPQLSTWLMNDPLHKATSHLKDINETGKKGIVKSRKFCQPSLTKNTEFLFILNKNHTSTVVYGATSKAQFYKNNAKPQIPIFQANMHQNIGLDRANFFVTIGRLA